MINLRSEFIDNEIWILVFGGGFQRTNIYKKGISEVQRVEFRNSLKEYISSFTEEYKKTVEDEKHISNILKICSFSTKYSSLLNNGQINFGVSQKLFNLYLKYQWCLNKIVEPPHFPVDRIIQEKMGFKPVISWTKMVDKEEYLSIIDFAKVKAKEKHLSLANLELDLFNRRNQK